jgi:hypothetical protein
MIIVVFVPLQPLQGGCSSTSQVGAHISTLTMELLLLTGCKTLQRAMPLINTDLVLSMLCADKSLALSKIDRAKIFLITLGLKKLSFLFRLLFWHSYFSFGFIVGEPTPLYFIF